MPALQLGAMLIMADRDEQGNRARAYGKTGWGMPSWGASRAMQFSGARGFPGSLRPNPVGARYFCGDCYGEEGPTAMYNQWSGSKQAYQDEVTAHINQDHPDLTYPLPQDALDLMEKTKRKQEAMKRRGKDLDRLAKFVTEHPELFRVEGGVDVSGGYQEVARPRELPDLTEFDFPDANLTDGSAEEIELDQLISIAARQGRRLLGVELQNLDNEFALEFATAPDNADLEIIASIELNTRTGAHNLDDPENLWRFTHRNVIANVEASAGAGTAIGAHFSTQSDIYPGGRVYVAPRLFFRFDNNMDRQVDTGDLFAALATVNQFLSSFLLFELLEEHSGLFALT